MMPIRNEQFRTIKKKKKKKHDQKQIVVSPYLIFYVIFKEKKFLTLYFINWPNFIAWLSLPLKKLGDTCVAVICFSVCDVIDFEINLSFLIKPFFSITKKPEQKSKDLKNEKGF